MNETSIASASPVAADVAAPAGGKPALDEHSPNGPTFKIPTFKIPSFDCVVVRVAGIVVPVAGILFPSTIFCFLFLGSWQKLLQVMSFSPLECTTELATFSVVPVGLFVLWRSMLGPAAKLRLKRNFLAGMVISSSTLAVLFSTLLQLEFTVTMAGICALLASLYIAFRMNQSWEFASSRRTALTFTFIGALFSFLSIALAQLPSSLIRVAEALATSDTERDKRQGMELLRYLHGERELTLNCQTKSTASILVNLIPLNEAKLQQVLFALTGRVPSSEQTNTVDASLGEQVVGTYLPSLSMSKSSFYLVPSVKNLCATTYWTMIFRNQDNQPHEARIKIHLPPLAVVSGMTFWIDGKPRTATVCSSANATEAYQRITQGRRDPALVTDLGNQSILAQCYPVPAGGETKLRLSLAQPLGITADSRATLSFPTVEQCNCSVADNHDVQVETKEPPPVSNISFAKANSEDALFEGRVSNRDLQVASLTFASKPAIQREIWLRGTSKSAIHTSIVKVHRAIPKQLIVVMDGSASLKESGSSILKAIKKISTGIPCTIFFAQDKEVAPITITQDKDIANNVKYEGGIDNTKTLIQACDFAGRKAGAAVLWIHGPQPGYDNAMYALSPHLIPPTIYEMRSDAKNVPAGALLLRNHRELGELVQVPQHENIADDLQVLAKTWTQSDRQVVFTYGSIHEGGKDIADLPYCREADCLAAHLHCGKLLAAYKNQAAIDFAISKSIVSPVTAAVVLENSTDYQSFGINEHPELTKNAKKATDPVDDGDIDTNKGTAYLTRKMYFYRFPAAKEGGPTELGSHDVIKDQRSISPQDTSDNVREQYFKRFPFASDVAGMISLPTVSHTQFQMLVRNNDNSMLSLLMSAIMLLCPLTVSAAIFLWYRKASSVDVP